MAYRPPQMALSSFALLAPAASRLQGLPHERRSALPSPAMSSLESLWKEGRKGALCPLEQMRAWALRVTQRDLLGGEGAVNYAAIADRVTKVGGGHPGRDAIRQFLDRVDADPDWYPGKNYKTRSGPAPVLRGAKRRQVAKSAMGLKKGGGEPTYPAIAARCPAAVLNPDTREAVDKKQVYALLKSDCYDRTPEEPWACEPVYTRRFLPDVGRPGGKIGLQCSGEKAPASVAHPRQAGAAQLWPTTRGCGARDDRAQASATRDISATARWTLWSGAILVPAWYQ